MGGQVVVPPDFPGVSTENNGEVAPGYLFLTSSVDVEGVGYYLMVLDNEGDPVMYRKLPEDYAYDFKMQPSGLLSYAQFISHHRYTGGGNCIHMLLDQQMKVVDSIQMKNGYVAEAHDFQLLPNGHALMFGYYMTQVDLSERVQGGYPDAKVSGGIIQELDDYGKVIFQWRSWDHYDIETYEFNRRANQQEVSAFHLNSINLDDDGHILVATPNWVKKISRTTGEVLWTLGGKENEFLFAGVDSLLGVDQVSGHAFHRIENGNYLVYNNGGRMYSQATSSAHEYRLDQDNRIAESRWSYYPDSTIPAWHRGNAQRLPNGNTLIGWGGASGASIPVCTEVDSGGQVVFEAHFSNEQVGSYRAFRFPLAPGPFAEDTLLNAARVAYYHRAPLQPRFDGKDPRVIPGTIKLEGGYAVFGDEIVIDGSHFQIPDPSDLTIYYRDAVKKSIFQPLDPHFNPADSVFTAGLPLNFPVSAELVFGYPDIESRAMTPSCRNPENLSRVQQEMPVRLEWTTEGLFTGFALQIAADSLFENLLEEHDSLKSTVYVYSAPANLTYYWRVKAFSQGYHELFESPWSDPFSFTVTDSYLTLLSPIGNEKWIQAASYFVRWQDNFEEDITIELYNNHQLVDQLAVTNSDGAWKWRVPQNLNPGCLYEIRIYSSEDLSLKDESSGYFSIVDSTGDDPCVVSSAEVRMDPELVVSSIPGAKGVRVTFYSEKLEEIQIHIFNSQGQCIYMGESTTWHPGTHSIDIPLENHPHQLLIISAAFGNRIVNRKYLQ